MSKPQRDKSIHCIRFDPHADGLERSLKEGARFRVAQGFHLDDVEDPPDGFMGRDQLATTFWRASSTVVRSARATARRQVPDTR